MIEVIHFFGIGQTIRFLWDTLVIGLALYELIIRHNNGIILGLLIFAIGDAMNAIYSTLDSLALIFGFLELSAQYNQDQRLIIIGTGTWISDIGRIIIMYSLWFKTK